MAEGIRRGRGGSDLSRSRRFSSESSTPSGVTGAGKLKVEAVDGVRITSTSLSFPEHKGMDIEPGKGSENRGLSVATG